MSYLAWYLFGLVTIGPALLTTTKNNDPSKSIKIIVDSLIIIFWPIAFTIRIAVKILK